MRLYVDKEADALYLRLDESDIVESEEVSPALRSTTMSPMKLLGSHCCISRSAPPS